MYGLGKRTTFDHFTPSGAFRTQRLYALGFASDHSCILYQLSLRRAVTLGARERRRSLSSVGSLTRSIRRRR